MLLGLAMLNLTLEFIFFFIVVAWLSLSFIISYASILLVDEVVDHGLLFFVLVVSVLCQHISHSALFASLLMGVYIVKLSLLNRHFIGSFGDPVSLLFHQLLKVYYAVWLETPWIQCLPADDLGWGQGFAGDGGVLGRIDTGVFDEGVAKQELSLELDLFVQVSEASIAIHDILWHSEHVPWVIVWVSLRQIGHGPIVYWLRQRLALSRSLPRPLSFLLDLFDLLFVLFQFRLETRNQVEPLVLARGQVVQLGLELADEFVLLVYQFLLLGKFLLYFFRVLF